MEPIIKMFIKEAIGIEKAGLEVEMKEMEEYTVPEELQQKFVELPVMKTTFEALTPGRKRAYLLQFSKTKQSKPRQARIVKYTQHILDGKGMNDK